MKKNIFFVTILSVGLCSAMEQHNSNSNDKTKEILAYVKKSVDQRMQELMEQFERDFREFEEQLNCDDNKKKSVKRSHAEIADKSDKKNKTEAQMKSKVVDVGFWQFDED